jgi:hypothetical protein
MEHDGVLCGGKSPIAESTWGSIVTRSAPPKRPRPETALVSGRVDKRTSVVEIQLSSLSGITRQR